MVVRRTIEHLKTRPEDERKAVAGWIAFIVALLLFLAWAASFFR